MNIKGTDEVLLGHFNTFLDQVELNLLAMHAGFYKWSKGEACKKCEREQLKIMRYKRTLGEN